jgi:ketosteroid isomerase-like protein
MTEESTTPDLVELTGRLVDAWNRRDIEAVMSFFAPDVVWIGLLQGFEGAAAIRRFVLEWWGTFDDLSMTLEDVQEVGGGVVLSVFRQHGRPGGSSVAVDERGALIAEWADGRVARLRVYVRDIVEARAAAERLAGERG